VDLRARLQANLGRSYTLERELGGGGMSRVFVATETRFHRAVVVKVLSAELAAGVSADRFEREIQLAASLQQANIVPLLSAGEMDGLPYYTMPFVEGESLRARLATTGPFAVNDCVSVLRDLARALSYAHKRGVVHRDIKPDNILLSHGAAVVTDFGIAKAITASRTQPGATLTQAGMTVGTPAYMAPEQVAADPGADHRLDLYAFGCVAYELLTGRPPFSGGSPHELLAAQLAQRPPSVRELRPDTPSSLDALIARCLAKQPGERPASADEVLRTLDAVATPGVEAQAVRVGPRWRRARSIALVVSALIVLGVAGALLRGRLQAHVPKSIAVVPLKNLSGDPANDYFGEGLAEEITGALAKAGLHVIGRGSARALADQKLDAREIGRRLNVATVLEGNVQRSGSRVRIGATLTATADGSVLWTQTYDREFADVFAVQDEIARTVARELHATLVGGQAAKLVHTETTDPQAHSLYLQGIYLWNRRTAPEIRHAIALFDQALARDPNYARARAGIALATCVLPFYADDNTDSLIALTRAAAKRALDADSTLAEAWTAIAYANALEWKNADAERDFSRAIAADSTFAPARHWHGMALLHVGLLDSARREFARARELEPTSLVIQTAAGILELADRRFDEALAFLRQPLSLDSSYAIAQYVLGTTLVEAGQVPRAIATLEPLVGRPSVRPSEIRGELALAYARAGRVGDARRTIKDLENQRGELPPTGVVAAAVFAVGDRDRAIAALQAAVDQHDPWLINFGRSPRFDRLRSDSAGRRLLELSERP
jgi:serine/threonine-protein kinase